MCVCVCESRIKESARARERERNRKKKETQKTKKNGVRTKKLMAKNRNGEEAKREFRDPVNRRVYIKHVLVVSLKRPSEKIKREKKTQRKKKYASSFNFQLLCNRAALLSRRARDKTTTITRKTV